MKGRKREVHITVQERWLVLKSFFEFQDSAKLDYLRMKFEKIPLAEDAMTAVSIGTSCRIYEYYRCLVLNR